MRSKVFRLLFAVLIMVVAHAGLMVTTAAQAGIPGSRSQINLDTHGVALGGYDPVAYFDGGKPTRGISAISASYGGARYLFATAAHRRAFVENPKKYLPQFGGFCVVGTAFGEKADANWPAVKD
jgi:YHS domain-containing protein